MNKQLLVIGSDGFLGSKVKELFHKDYNLIHLKSGSWDLQNTLRDKPVVLMLRAMSSPSFVQQNSEESHALNVIKTSQLIAQCLNAGSKVIFTSSDVVYGHSSSAIFTELDHLNPFGTYATQKAEIEKLFHGNSNFFSLRLSLVTGQGSKLLRILSEETNPRIPGDVIRNPVHFKYVLATIRSLLECESWQDISKDLVFNIGGRESLDIFELAQRIAIKEKLNYPVRIERSELDLFSRPEVTRINSDKAEDFTNLKFSTE
jgi:dTDP-4-dehydrorhamnose reductase